MKRLKKISYSYSEFLYNYAINSGKEIFEIEENNTRKFGDESPQDERIDVKIYYYISKEDLEYIVKLQEGEITEERWENFYNYIKKINVADFDDLQYKYRYDAIEDINRKLPNEDISTYEIETFNFKYIGQDYDTINIVLGSTLIKIYN